MRMSVESMRLPSFVLACCLLCHASAIAAGDDDLPDVEFLEYLGSWEESDEDWLLVRDVEKIRERARRDEGSDSVPEDRESSDSDQ